MQSQPRAVENRGMKRQTHKDTDNFFVTVKSQNTT
jgi:hypothetical protein